jgi:tetratricopeptide (TPR) repeat protein
MHKILPVLIILIVCARAVLAQAGSPTSAPTNPPAAVPSAGVETIETGKILPDIHCAAHPEQSYALYLPSGYSPFRRWPLVVSSDPGAQGTIPLDLQKAAAERLGYILVASNNSRNGPWKPRLEATHAVLTNVQTRFPIDSRRIYFAGFSGGARFSSQLAALCKCSAGLLLSGAGFSQGLAPDARAALPVFSTVGIFDFNYKEMIPLQDELAKAAYPHWLRIFDGSHQWPPADVMDEALTWFRIEEMKMQIEPRDQAFIDAQFAKARARAESFEHSGDLLDAQREYSQIADTFDSLGDATNVATVASRRAKAQALAEEKAVREAAKREQNDFKEEHELASNIVALVVAPSNPGDRFQSDQDLQSQIVRLRENAEREKRAEKLRVYKRALGDVLVTAMETGNSLLDEKKFQNAARDFELATQAVPDSEWAWSQLALARAAAGDKREALASLRRAYELANDKPSFRKWLETEPAFAPLRSSPEFQTVQK